MKQLKKQVYGIGFCLLIAVPAWLLGKWLPVVGGPVFAILIGMCLALLIKEQPALEPGVKYTSEKNLQTGGDLQKTSLLVAVQCTPIFPLRSK